MLVTGFVTFVHTLCITSDYTDTKAFMELDSDAESRRGRWQESTLLCLRPSKPCRLMISLCEIVSCTYYVYIYICWSSRLPEGLVTLCLTPICWDTEQSVQLDRLSSPERHGKQRLPAVQTFVTFVSSLSTATPSASIEASRHRGIDSQGHPRQCGDVKLEALTGKSLKTKPE